MTVHDGPDERAGRMCPADYRYPPTVFDRPPDFAANVLYVVGGLYGNLPALDCVERLAGAERATVVFNGDFHWFDAEIEGEPIRVAGHCYGCTAGQGSSCGGALKQAAE